MVNDIEAARMNRQRIERDRLAEKEVDVAKQAIGEYDRHREEILTDYAQMTVTDLQRKWGMGRSSFYPLKRKWEIQGFNIPIAFADRNTATKVIEKPVVIKKTPHAKLGRPRTGLATNCVDCGTELYGARNRIREGKEYRCRGCMSRKAAKAPRKRTPTVREEHQKAVLSSEDKIEITVGRLEEILRELEYLKGYRQAVLDIFSSDNGAMK